MRRQRVAKDGARDPISAGTVGDAVVRGGSRAEVGMPANPDGAHQVNRHMVDREIVQWVVDLDECEGVPRHSAAVRRAAPRCAPLTITGNTT